MSYDLCPLGTPKGRRCQLQCQRRGLHQSNQRPRKGKGGSLWTLHGRLLLIWISKDASVLSLLRKYHQHTQKGVWQGFSIARSRNQFWMGVSKSVFQEFKSKLRSSEKAKERDWDRCRPKPLLEWENSCIHLEKKSGWPRVGQCPFHNCPK